MYYRRFLIKDYRAIRGPLEISIAKTSLIPIIGVNECGKTTILHALLCFDCFMDDFGRHLKDVQNLYESNPKLPEISAEIGLTPKALKLILSESEVVASIWNSIRDAGDEEEASESTKYTEDEYNKIEKAKKELLTWLLDSCKSILTLTRVLSSPPVYKPMLTPELPSPPSWGSPQFWDTFLTRIVAHLPYILYFDEFKHQIDERIEIVEKEKSEWLQILNILFKSVHPDCTVSDLREREERQRKSMLAKVNKALNETLTDEWRNFRLDNTDALEINIDYEEEGAGASKRSYLRFDVVETDANGDKHFFFIRDRSKGFYWFFNFVMRLEFNPKTVDGSGPDAVYLLDEPGSYLHAVAQEKLCKKLRQISKDHAVIYCTHSHHLLNPDVIPLNTIQVAQKDAHGDVTIVPMHSHAGRITNTRSAFQPVYDALQLRPTGFDISSNTTVIIAEGIIDFYALELFKPCKDLRILPSVGAASIPYFVSLMIAWQIPYRALWDNDDEGRECHRKAVKHFGTNEGSKHLFLLPPRKPGSDKDRILQDLFDGGDIRLFKADCGLPKNCSFDKVITSLFHNEDRQTTLQNVSHTTQRHFSGLFSHLGIE